MPSPCSLRFLSFAQNIGKSEQVKICDVLVVESIIGVRKLAERSEAKKNPNNCVRFFDTVPRIFCSLLPKLLSFAPCSLAFLTPCSLLPAPCTFGPHSPRSLEPLAESHECFVNVLNHMNSTRIGCPNY